MKYVKNDSGLTLLEVLASIVILSIVIVSFVSLFPQMSLFNQKTEENLDAVTIAKEVLVKMKSAKYTELESGTSLIPVNYELSNENTLALSGQYREKYIEIYIERTEESYRGNGLNKHEMQIRVYKSSENQNPLSTIYGFTLH